ncbi:predicted protein [Lichtheimia corymbifera JMRC:FSU:9682]|uniref:Uncharacterized protein n=1 Tax=Lichtheimia corymbifera JMRC:FSU:9682 TaxID=1263082 RepID=A0A068RPG9_9FUNG|nr:predicted protein [Lichtheimia corymbifera JMRC:FSU:9682]
MHVIGGSYQQLAQEAATMCNRIHTFSANNIYSILCRFSSLANYFFIKSILQRISLMSVSYQQQATMCVDHSIKANFYILFGAIKVYLISLELSVPSPIALKDEDQHLALADFSEASKRSLLDQFMAVVVKDTVSMVLEISSLQVISLLVDPLGNVSYRCHGVYHFSSTCVDTLEVLSASHILANVISSRPDLFVAVHDVSLMTPTQKGRLMAATTDMADVYLLWVERDGALKSIVGSYDLYATVWSALSWPYQLHLRITVLAVGSQTVTRPNMLARAAPIEDAVVYNGNPRYPAWCTAGVRMTAKPSRGHPCQYMVTMEANLPPYHSIFTRYAATMQRN